MNPPPKGQFQAGVPVQQASGRNLAAEAVGQLGQSVKQTGNLALELQLEQDRQYLTDAEMVMRRESAKLATELAGNMNPANHATIAKDRFDSVVNDILGSQDFRPSFQKELESRLKMFSSAKIEKVAQDAKLIQLENGRRLQSAKIKMFQADGDFDGAHQAAKDGIGTYWSKEDAEIMGMDIDRRERNEEYTSQANAGNVEYFDQDLPIADSDKERFKARAEATKARAEADEVGRIQGAMEIGEILTKEDLARNIEEAQNITEETAKKMLQNWDKNKPLTAKEKMDHLDRLNSLYKDFKAGKMDKLEYLKAHSQVSNEIYAMGSRPGTGGLRQRAYALDPAKWQDGVPPSAGKEESKINIESMVSDFASAGGLGTVPKGDGTTPAQKYQSKQAIREAREMLEMAMMEWLKTEEGQKATKKQISNQIMKEAAAIGVSQSIETAFPTIEDDYQSILDSAGNTMLPSN